MMKIFFLIYTCYHTSVYLSIVCLSWHSNNPYNVICATFFYKVDVTEYFENSEVCQRVIILLGKGKCIGRCVIRSSI